jgi:16S rRNA (uracil1498-N3)-methyltransferase
MRRFFVQPISSDESVVALGREESHHLTRVLRLNVADEVELLDGAGNLYCGRIQSLGEVVLVGDLKRQAAAAEDAAPLWVCQGDLKGKKMDVVVQKCTELGVSRILPFTSSRSQGRLEPGRSEHRRERWETIVKSACKQSGRLTIMACEAESALPELLTGRVLPDQAVKILFWEEEQALHLGDLSWEKEEKPFCLMLGPEGGFSVAEVEMARNNGWHIVSLGRQILRAETATIAAVAIVQHLRGVM